MPQDMRVSLSTRAQTQESDHAFSAVTPPATVSADKVAEPDWIIQGFRR